MIGSNPRMFITNRNFRLALKSSTLQVDLHGKKASLTAQEQHGWTSATWAGASAQLVSNNEEQG